MIGEGWDYNELVVGSCIRIGVADASGIQGDMR